MSATATMGIDLASQPQNTALCVIEWKDDAATVSTLLRGTDAHGTPLHDTLLSSALEGLWGDIAKPSKVGIDAPLGWPRDFVRAVATPDEWPVGLKTGSGEDPRKRLLRRATDHWIHDTVGKLPLSVSSDKIAYPAMRAAALLAHYGQRTGERVDRSGASGLICEAYPDPSIRAFDLWPSDHVTPRASYKGANVETRRLIVDRLRRNADWLFINEEQAQSCVDFDDNLDALICALVARAAERGQTHEPPAELADEAREEGWIHLPIAGSLSELR